MSEQAVCLSDRIRDRGPLRPDDAALLLLPVAEELAALHRGGAVHGAVSPDAIGIGADGRALLLPRSGVVADPRFMPPGPDRSWRPHPADDVWSLAAVLSAVTTGQAPSRPSTTPTATWLTPITELALAADDRDRPTMAELADYLRARAASPAPDAGAARTGSAVSPARLGLLAAGAVVLIAIAGAALLFGGGDDDQRRARPGEPTGRTEAASTASATASPRATASAPQVSADELVQFARTYVATASRDPARGFALLTPTYQDASPRYVEVWRGIRSPRILRVSADPATLSVTYTYRYTRSDGRQRTEEVTLRLVKAGDSLLIAGATARSA